VNKCYNLQTNSVTFSKKCLLTVDSHLIITLLDISPLGPDKRFHEFDERLLNFLKRFLIHRLSYLRPDCRHKNRTSPYSLHAYLEVIIRLNSHRSKDVIALVAKRNPRFIYLSCQHFRRHLNKKYKRISTLIIATDAQLVFSIIESYHYEWCYHYEMLLQK
jgi:hypothetical protein